MISWSRILYGAVLTTVIAAVVFVVLRRERRLAVLAAALGSTLAGPVAWNAILHRAGGAGFFVDIPFAPFPVSWQDTGSGVFTLAVASVVLSLLLRREVAGRVIGIAATAAAVAFLVDIYLY